jgi:transcriptional regulator with XRE-family HTH domain
MTFGEKLQALRQSAGMSQDALAERLDVSRQAVSRWERDETMPETDKVVALADIFGVTTDYLLRPQAAEQPSAEEHPPRSGPTQAQRDTISRLGYLVKTKGYLLGWVLIAWGALDLLALALMGLGVLNFIFW